MSGADIFIGLMSGTSADAIDAVMTRFKGDGAIETIASHSKAMPEGLKPIFLRCKVAPHETSTTSAGSTLSLRNITPLRSIP